MDLCLRENQIYLTVHLILVLNVWKMAGKESIHVLKT